MSRPEPLPCTCRETPRERFENPTCPRHVIDVQRRFREARDAVAKRQEVQRARP